MSDAIQPVSYRKARLLDYVSAGAVRVSYRLLQLLPFSWASNLGGSLARAIGPMLSQSRIARKNLKAAFPEKSEAEIEMIVREVWETLGRTAFEFPLMSRLIKGPERARVEIVGEPHLRAALASGKPVLFFGAHLANWELLPITSAMLGFGVNIFYRAPNNPLLLDLFATRLPVGEVIPKGAAGARRAFALLKKGQNLGLLVDQKLNDGIAVPFFGRDAMTSTALAEFALRFDAPVVPIHCERLPGVRFRVTFEEPLKIEKTGARKADVQTIMTTVNAIMENWIRQAPGQWLWLHRRWPD